MGGIFAILAAFCFTVDTIFLRKGLMKENHGTIWEIRFVVSFIAIIAFVLGSFFAAIFGFNVAAEFRHLSSMTILILVIAGIFGPSIGAVLNSMAIGQIGASHASALWAGSNPLFAVLLAIIILGEVPNLIGIISVLIIISGIVIVGYHIHEGTAVLLEKTKLSGGVIALISGMFVALSQIGRGAAINLGATPIAALFFFLLTGFLALGATCLIKSKNIGQIRNINRQSLYCYTGSGIGFLIGNYFFLISLNLIPVWQAVAIRNVQPILSLVLSWLLLKKVDKISIRLVLGAVLVSVGIVLLNLYQ